MRLFAFFLCCCISLLSNQVTEKTWATNLAFYDYLAANNIDSSLLADLDDETFGALKTILAETPYYEHRDEESDRLLHALIPIGDERQISLYYDKAAYRVEIIPVRYYYVTETLNAELKNSLRYDLAQITGNGKLASELVSIFEAKIDFNRDLFKNDRVGAVYDRKIRLGRTWSAIIVKSAFIETRKKRHYAIYRSEDESYYDETGKTLANLFLKYPTQFRKITSEYLPNGRVHPLLGVIRPHLGVDFAAPKGTPVVSVADGVVRFRGCQKECDSGYGRLVIIEHKNGWESRYAHLNDFANSLTPGARVKQGQTIGFVGQSGTATGSHLHFEARKGGQTTNPLALRNVRQNGLEGKELEKFLAEAKELLVRLDYLADVAESGVTRITSARLSESDAAN
ncbi:MAG: peptidoglycan DD-metalloendopeptidase family protein [Helicobacteraceae bacterium]|jgi:murein DD-endopeptidase MepM/ murein hydrolase activator NlpD|nr:peptidoglycan DD-metalloendopeptidase family protein [Helicobacteraceae bacterium]